MVNSSAMADIREGSDVYGSDGDKVGSIVSMRPDFLVVEKGFFFPTDYYIPMAAVSSSQDGKVYLNVTKDAALNQGWDAIPADYETSTATYETTSSATDAGYMDSAYETGTLAGSAAGSVGMQAGSTAAESLGMTGDRDMSSTTIEAGETISVPVREEELTATKRRGQTGEVRIEKDVVSQEQVLEVPVTEERVRVQRRAVDREVTATDGNAFEETVIEVPVYGEDVELQKRVRVSEEIEIGKEAVQSTERVTGTVRREEVRISDDVTGGVDGVIDNDTAIIDPNASGTRRGSGQGASGI